MSKYKYNYDKRPPAVFLEIQSWVGLSIGAQHYYGKLGLSDRTLEWKERHEKEVQVQKPMTSKEAKERNKAEHIEGSSWRWKKGDMTHGFATEKELRERALVIWKEHFPEYNLLLEGTTSTLDPCLVIDAPPEFMEQGNVIVAGCESNNWWEGDEDAMEKLSQQWDKLITAFPFDKWTKDGNNWVQL